MDDLGPSLIRTWTPIMVGGLISWSASLGINVDTQTKGSLMIAATALTSGAYYTAARLLERRFPKLGILLGTKGQPTYAVVAPVAAVAPVEAPSPAPPIA
jgi:hypothetical protein